jgi:hypothetical protein
LLPYRYKRTQPGTYNLNVHAECDFELEGGVKLPGEQELMRVGAGSANAVSQAHAASSRDPSKAAWPTNTPVLEEEDDDGRASSETKSGEGSAAKKSAAAAAAAAATTTTSNNNYNSSATKCLSISKAQFFEKAEQLRDRFVTEAKKLGVSAATIKNLFVADKKTPTGGDREPTYAEFKRRLMDIGFSLTDLPDEDLLVLDKDNNGSISPDEFLEFFKLGVSFEDGESGLTPPTPPVDDLVCVFCYTIVLLRSVSCLWCLRLSPISLLLLTCIL